MMPLRALVLLVYPELRSRRYVVQYAWYRSKSDYQQILKTSKDDPDEVIKDYSAWKKRAEERLSNFRDNNILYMKVAIDPIKLETWLKKNNLENLSKNREDYIKAVYKDAMKNGIQNKPVAD
jgi:uncharacterized Ntn-hydrolase superfamily protein